MISLLGSGISTASVTYLITSRQGITDVGWVQGIPLIVSILVAPFVGAYTDKKNVRHVILGASTALAVITLLLTHFSVTWYIFVLAARVPFDIAMSAVLARVLPAVAPKDSVVTASGRLSLTGRLATAVGLALGPILANSMGPAVFALDAATFAVTIALFWRLQIPPTATASADLSLFRHFVDSLHYIKARPVVLYVAMLYVATGLAWAAKDTLFVSYVSDQLTLSPGTWSGIYASTALAGEVLSATLIATKRVGSTELIPKVLTLISAVMIATLLITGLTHSAAIAFPVKFVEGFCTNMIGVLAVSYVSLLAADHVRGRMKTLLTMTNGVSLAGGQVVLTALAGLNGPGQSYVIAAVAMTIVVVVSLLVLRPFSHSPVQDLV